MNYHFTTEHYFKKDTYQVDFSWAGQGEGYFFLEAYDEDHAAQVAQELLADSAFLLERIERDRTRFQPICVVNSVENEEPRPFNDIVKAERLADDDWDLAALGYDIDEADE